MRGIGIRSSVPTTLLRRKESVTQKSTPPGKGNKVFLLSHAPLEPLVYELQGTDIKIKKI